MMGIETIRRVNAERAEAAAAEGLEPFTYASPDEVEPGFPFPHIGTHLPAGWRLAERHFADALGVGEDDEPALSVRQFVALLRERVAEHGTDVGFAVIEAGQFQVWVGEFHRI